MRERVPETQADFRLTKVTTTREVVNTAEGAWCVVHRAERKGGRDEEEERMTEQAQGKIIWIIEERSRYGVDWHEWAEEWRGTRESLARARFNLRQEEELEDRADVGHIRIQYRLLRCEATAMSEGVE